MDRSVSTENCVFPVPVKVTVKLMELIGMQLIALIGIGRVIPPRGKVYVLDAALRMHLVF